MTRPPAPHALNITLRGLAAVVPAQKQSILEFSDAFGNDRTDRIAKATGIDHVRVAPDTVCTSDLGVFGAERLFEELGIDRQEMDAVVFGSHTPDHLMPATSCLIQHRLGLRSDGLSAFDLPYSCSAFTYSLIQAGLLISAGLAENVLVIVGDTMVRRVNPADRALRMVLGDGAAAAIVSGGKEKSMVRFGSDGAGRDSLIVPAGGCRLPISEETGIVEFDSEGRGRSKNDLYMDGTAILRFALDRIPPMVEGLMADTGWTRDDVDYLFMHQANKFIVDSLRKKLEFPAAKAPVHVSDFGNTGPATIPLAICSELAGADTLPSKVILAGFGVGLSWAGLATSLEDCAILPVFEMP